MTIAFSNVVAANYQANVTAINLANTSFVSGQYYLFTVYVEQTNVSGTLSGGITWTNLYNFGDSNGYLRLFGGYCSSTTTATLTFNQGSTTTMYYLLDTATGVASSGSIVQENGKGSSSSPISVTLSTFSSPNNATYMVTGGYSQTAPTAGTGMTLTSSYETASRCVAGEYELANNTAPPMNFTPAAYPISAIAIEVAAAGGGSTTINVVNCFCG